MENKMRFVKACFQWLLVLPFLLLADQPSEAGMGLAFGDIGTVATEAVCIPEEQPVLSPGPFGSPLRISPAGTDGYLVVDYRQRAIYLFNPLASGPPTLLFNVEGKPLSVARVTDHGVSFWVGNDQDKTIDLYQLKRGDFRLKKQLFRKSGLQALDIAVAESIKSVYVVDGLTAEVKVLTYAGKPVGNFGGIAQDNQLIAPKAIAVDDTSGVLAVSYYGDPLQANAKPVVGIFDLAGNPLLKFVGNFARPQGVAINNDRLFLADSLRGEVQEFDRIAGTWTATYGCFGSGEGHLLLPMDVALDSAGQTLYVADNRNGRITVLPLTP